MAPLCAELSRRLGVPVIDGVAAAVKLAESLVGLGLQTSAHGDYAPPLPKPFAGWAAPLAL
jgi:allantoin racemase